MVSLSPVVAKMPLWSVVAIFCAKVSAVVDAARGSTRSSLHTAGKGAIPRFAARTGQPPWASDRPTRTNDTRLHLHPCYHAEEIMGMSRTYRFTFGPWNISQGADPFGPTVRPNLEFAVKLREYKKLGFDGVQLHDDDVVPADWNAEQTRKGVADVKKMLADEGLFAEFIAPRLWEDPRTIDGAY